MMLIFELPWTILYPNLISCQNGFQKLDMDFHMYMSMSTFSIILLWWNSYNVKFMSLPSFKRTVQWFEEVYPQHAAALTAVCPWNHILP